MSRYSEVRRYRGHTLARRLSDGLWCTWTSTGRYWRGTMLEFEAMLANVDDGKAERAISRSNRASRVHQAMAREAAFRRLQARLRLKRNAAIAALFVLPDHPSQWPLRIATLERGHSLHIVRRSHKGELTSPLCRARGRIGYVRTFNARDVTCRRCLDIWANRR